MDVYTIEDSEILDRNAIEFPDGSTLKFDEFSPVRDDEGDITSWACDDYDSRLYIIWND